MKKALTALTLSVAILASSVAPASALQIKDHRERWGMGTYQLSCYYDYNWFETYILGKRDGWRYNDACR